MLDRKVLFVSMLILVFLAIGTVSATDNLTDEISLDDGPSAQGIEIPKSRPNEYENESQGRNHLL